MSCAPAHSLLYRPSRFNAYKPPSTPPPPPSPFSFALSFNNILAMIMVQKPVHLHSSPSTYHRRHPSAPPVVHVQPTHVPGLFSLSKPHPVTPPRSQQQHQNNNRQSRLSNNKSKPTSNARASQPTTALTAAQPLLSEDLNKLSTPGRPATKPHPVPVTSSVTPEKHPRGRQNLKHGKDKSKLRYAGDSCARNDILSYSLSGATLSPARERTTIGETRLNITRVLPQTFQTFPRRQRPPTNAILFHFLILFTLVSTTRLIPSLSLRRVNPTTPLRAPLRLILPCAPLRSSRPARLASLLDVVRITVILLPPRRLPKPCLSLVVLGSSRPGRIGR